MTLKTTPAEAIGWAVRSWSLAELMEQATPINGFEARSEDSTRKHGNPNNAVHRWTGAKHSVSLRSRALPGIGSDLPATPLERLIDFSIT
jgi:hypothetical protein